MKKNIIKSLLLCSASLVAFSASGCGKNSKITDNTIYFWHTFGQTITKNIQTQIDEFEKIIKETEGVDINIELVAKSNYDTINDAINKGFSTANVPTLAVAYPDHVADYIKAEGSESGKYVVNLQDFIDSDELGFGKESWEPSKEGISDFVSSWIDEGKHFTKEGMYCFPYLKSSEVMFYNLTVLRRVMPLHDSSIVGDDAIKEYMNNLSWDGFIDLCETIWKNKDKATSALVYPAFYDSDSNLFISQLMQSNIGFSSVKDGKGVIDFKEGENRTKAEALVSKLADAYNNHLLTTKGVTTTYGSDSFKKGESIFSIGSSGGSGYNFSTEFDIGVCKVPALNNNPLYVSQGVSLAILNSPKYSKTENEFKTKYAWKLVKYLTGAENNATLCFKGSEGYMPVRESAYTTDIALDFLSNPDYGTYGDTANVVRNDIADKYFSTACFPGSAVLREEVGNLITSALKGTDVSSAFDTAINNALLKF